MKKIIIIILMLIGVSAFGQSVFTQVILESAYDVSTATDTLIAKTYISNRASIQYDVYWSGLAGTLDGLIYLKSTSLPDSLVVDSVYVTYPNIAKDTLNAAYGYCSFTDESFTASRVALYFDKNNITAGTILVVLTKKVY